MKLGASIHPDEDAPYNASGGLRVSRYHIGAWLYTQQKVVILHQQLTHTLDLKIYYTVNFSADYLAMWV